VNIPKSASIGYCRSFFIFRCWFHCHTRESIQWYSGATWKIPNRVYASPQDDSYQSAWGILDGKSNIVVQQTL